MGGNIRSSYGGKLGVGNVFGVQVGICIAFLVKTPTKNYGQRIFYYAVEDGQSRADKLNNLKGLQIGSLPFRDICPDKYENWLNLTDNDFEDLLPLCSKQAKLSKSKTKEQALFKLYLLGVNTARDAWVYDFNKQNLEKKGRFLSQVYNKSVRKEEMNYVIKWSRDLKNEFLRKKLSSPANSIIRGSLFRPFVKKHYYSEKLFSDFLTEKSLSNVWAARRIGK